jgi:hypothetical protein
LFVGITARVHDQKSSLGKQDDKVATVHESNGAQDMQDAEAKVTITRRVTPRAKVHDQKSSLGQQEEVAKESHEGHDMQEADAKVTRSNKLDETDDSHIESTQERLRELERLLEIKEHELKAKDSVIEQLKIKINNPTESSFGEKVTRSNEFHEADDSHVEMTQERFHDGGSEDRTAAMCMAVGIRTVLKNSDWNYPRTATFPEVKDLYFMSTNIEQATSGVAKDVNEKLAGRGVTARPFAWVPPAGSSEATAWNLCRGHCLGGFFYPFDVASVTLPSMGGTMHGWFVEMGGDTYQGGAGADPALKSVFP